ncbi:MAG: diguanylate cyclase response regulator [Frankiales bacterium]|nr:diguanylate cyclase response regulator [Frankiales bacterium]
MRILVVDDEPAARLLAQAVVRAAGHEVESACDGPEAVERLAAEPFDVLVTDAQMPGMSGFELAERVRRDVDRYVYVIMLTGLHDDGERLAGMQAGVDDYLTKPLRPVTLTAHMIAAGRVVALHRTIEQQRRVLERQASRDGLTGLLNRLRLDADLDGLVQRAVRYGRPFCLALLDVDRFKAFNDACGHLSGDAALRTVADVLAAQVREVDAVYRYGGEEFVVLLPEQDLAGATVALERIRTAVQGQRLVHPDSEHGVVTLSAGLAASTGTAPLSSEGLLHAADLALYEAKAAGRNTIAVAAEALGVLA